ncbi:MAG: ATP-binding protein, partial [Dehalococcoidia bacterium]|nr:ATP-binding protein [Dehalococcoidia bacterium]
MAQQGKPVVSTGPRMLKRIAPWFLRKTAANMPKLSNVLEEFIRNARFHGHAENINISIVRGANGAPELHITDDGDGMLQRGRLHFAYCLGNPHGDRDDTQREKYGTGSGARFSAYGLCQVIEAITVPRDAPSGAAWRTVVHLPQFIEDAGGEISEDTDWDRTRRSDTPFDPKLTHGTMFILRDFRASDPRAPFDESRMRDTSRRVTEDEVRQIVEGFVPDIAKRVAVGGRRINPPKPAGYPLWAQNPREERGLGTVSGDIRYVEDARARWCTIGGTTATVSLRTFMDDCHEHRPDLSALLPRELFDARLSGYIRIAVLEDFPTQSREHLDPSFWATEAAAGSIMFLVQVVGPTLQARLAEYAARPASEETRASLERILARLHEAQGITPGHVAGGGGTDESAGPRPEDQPLQVNRVTIRIEVAQPDGVVERGTFRITNALDGETFTWTDGGKRLIESKGDHGESATVHAVRRAGVYPVDVQSDQYPNRKRTLNVDVYTPEEPVRGSEFRLIPERTVMSVGDEKEISIRSEGPTSGPYRWSAVRVRGGQRRAVDAFLEVRTGARQVVFRRPSEPGDYVVTVTCTKTNLT